MIAKKRILILSLSWFPFESGGENAPRNIADRLNDEYVFDVITYRFRRAWPVVEQVGQATVYRVGGLNKYDWMFRAFWKATVLHTANSYDAVWSVMAAYAGGVAYWFKRFHPRVSLILTLQEGDPLEHIMQRVGVTRPWFRDLFRRADAVQAISHYLAGLAKQLGFLGTPVVIPNGVDVEKFDAQNKYETTTKPVFPKNGKEIVLINNSRLVYKNAHDIIIRALRFLPEQVVYRNVAQQGDLGTELQALAEKEGVAHRVFLLPGIPHAEIPKWFEEGDLFVRPSRSEGLGTSFLEAMAARLPIVTTPVGGIPDFLTDGETGFFSVVDDPQSVAQAVQRYIDEPALREHIRATAEQLAVTRYSWDTVSGQMRDLFHNLLRTHVS
ncbi:MAG: hypothetical protein A2542_01785 [Parcubacteria group bacterium RIFOXYD2_FULL_52_8]|nr:MAG: hypothetical protein A2542_01785 [Parcubacteria group bacterium RIFOXYD2_FULL_52_8]